MGGVSMGIAGSVVDQPLFEEYLGMRVESVDMHNISADRIFRPHAWAAFGANEPQGADFRACANHAPLYG